MEYTFEDLKATLAMVKPLAEEVDALKTLLAPIAELAEAVKDQPEGEVPPTPEELEAATLAELEAEEEKV